MSRKPIIFDTSEKARKARRFNRLLRLGLVGLAVIAIVGASLHFHGIWQTEERAATMRLHTITELRRSSLKRFLDSHARETILWANNDKMRKVATEFITHWMKMTPAERAGMRHRFIDAKLRKGDDERLKEPGDAFFDYNDLHALVIGEMRNFMAHHGYYDVFFLTPAGDLAFSVAKEDDFGRNFAKDGGPYAESGLGRAFRKAMASRGKNHVVFVDFTPYAPSNGAPAAFFAAPILDSSNRKVGVYAIQLPVKKLDALMQYSAGLGDSGETYAVGPDFLMRNNSRLSKQPTLLKRKVETDAVKKALAGEAVTTTGTDKDGGKTQVIALPLEFMGVRWAVITEMSLAELRKPYMPYAWFYALTVLFIILMVAAQYWMLKREK